jgi:hypothetical protein
MVTTAGGIKIAFGYELPACREDMIDEIDDVVKLLEDNQ